MTKAEAEAAIRSLSREWALERYRSRELPPDAHPSFSEFRVWLVGRSLSGCLSFRSRGDAEDEAETWFDDELGQSWRR